MNEHRGAWHWFANRKVLTLWEAAHHAGYVTGSAAFPTSVGAKGDYIAPEFWWDGSDMDSLFIDAVSHPQGLVSEMEKEIGRYAGGLDLSDSGDLQRYRAADWLLTHRLASSSKPFFLTAYFASYDESAHEFGVYSEEAVRSLEKIDALAEKLVRTAEDVSGGNLIVCVVSDHGTMNNTHNICPNVIFKEEGLIRTDDRGAITDWSAFSQRAGGISEIRLVRKDESLRQRVSLLLEHLKADPSMGISEVLTGEQARQRGGFPEADFVLISCKGYEIRDDWSGDYLRTTVTQKAQHGYSEEFTEMRASFLLAGTGIAAGTVTDVRLIDVAPTLAARMGFALPDAEGRDVLARQQ